MHRVDTLTAAEALPASNPAGTPGYFTQGDLLNGIPATVPGQDWFNAVQEELVNIVEEAEIVPDKGDNTQILQALNALIEIARQSAIVAAVAATPPVGAEMFWPTEVVPDGWLEENGASLLRSAYPGLFSVIGTMYGAADGTHFNLPDMRGKFPRIWAHGQATDPDRAARTAPTAPGATIAAGDHVGTEQDHAIEAHTHSVSTTAPANNGGDVSILQVNTVSSTQTGSTGGNETRPINAYRMMIIKC